MMPRTIVKIESGSQTSAKELVQGEPGEKSNAGSRINRQKIFQQSRINIQVNDTYQSKPHKIKEQNVFGADSDQQITNPFKASEQYKPSNLEKKDETPTKTKHFTSPFTDFQFKNIPLQATATQLPTNPSLPPRQSSINPFLKSQKVSIELSNPEKNNKSPFGIDSEIEENIFLRDSNEKEKKKLQAQQKSQSYENPFKKSDKINPFASSEKINPFKSSQPFNPFDSKQHNQAAKDEPFGQGKKRESIFGSEIIQMLSSTEAFPQSSSSSQCIPSSKQLRALLSPYYNEHYLRYHMQTKKQRRQSKINLPDMIQNSLLRMSANKNLFYKPERIEFKRGGKSGDMSRSRQVLGKPASIYVGRYLKSKNVIYYAELGGEENMNNLKCQQLFISAEQELSPHIEFDPVHHRLFLFSNKTQTLSVYSLSSRKLIAKLPSPRHCINPVLYFYSVNNRDFLLLVGGYFKIEKDIVEGCKSVDVWEIGDWEITIKSSTMKMMVGRIAPIIILQKGSQGQDKLLIIGGHTTAKLKFTGELNFEHEQDINCSTNLTGLIIQPQHIAACLNSQDVTLYNTLAVQIQSPASLHSAFVLSFKSSTLLLLPSIRYLYQIRLINNQLNISRSKYRQYVDSEKEGYSKMEINYSKGDGKGMRLWRIEEGGQLEEVQVGSEDIQQATCACMHNKCSIF